MKHALLAVAVLLIASSLSAQSSQTAPAQSAPQSTQPPATAQPEAAPQTPDRTAAATPSTPTANDVFGNFFSAGLQMRHLDHRSSKFFEYRDVPEGITGPAFRLFDDASAVTFSVAGEHLGQADRRFTAFVDSTPLRVSVMYDQIPHRAGYDAHLIESRAARDAYGISDTVQQSFQNAIAAQWAISRPSVNGAFLAALVAPLVNTPNVVDVENLRRRASIGVQLFPDAPVDTHVTYFQENRTGTRPAGTSFGFADVVETPAPVEYRTREAGVSAEYGFAQGLVRGTVHLNDFSDEIASYTFDNPFRATSATDASAYQAPGTGSINGAAFGRVTLPPTNKALNVAAGGIYKLPLQSRLTADFGFGRWTQDEPFVPFTTNSAITNFTPLERSSLDGRINTTTAALTFTSRPLAHLNLTARYRYYNLDNRTPRLDTPGIIAFDATFTPEPRVTVPYSWRNNRAEIVGSYDVATIASVEAGFTSNRMWRNYREANTTTENLWHVATDVRPFTWATLRASYESGKRSFDTYDPLAGQNPSFEEPSVTPGNLPQLRRFDVAERNSSRVVGMLQLNPFNGPVNVSLNGTHYLDNYDKYSDYGLLDWRSDSYSIDADYSPTDRWSVYAFYTRDKNRGFQRGRQSGGTISTNPNDDWTADNIDEADSVGAGATFSIVPQRLDLQLLGRMQNVNGFVGIATPGAGLSGVGVSIPQANDTRLLTTSAELLYRAAARLELALGGWIEHYRMADAATTRLPYYIGGLGFFLAPDAADPSYSGNVAYVRAAYHF